MSVVAAARDIHGGWHLTADSAISNDVMNTNMASRKLVKLQGYVFGLVGEWKVMDVLEYHPNNDDLEPPDPVS